MYELYTYTTHDIQVSVYIHKIIDRRYIICVRKSKEEEIINVYVSIFDYYIH